MLHDLVIFFILIIIFYLIVFRHNVLSLYENNPELASKNSVSKFYQSKGEKAEKVFRIILLMIIPLMMTRTITYRGFLLSAMYHWNFIVDDIPISIDNQQYSNYLIQAQMTVSIIIHNKIPIYQNNRILYV